jgi:hypothetical protein
MTVQIFGIILRYQNRNSYQLFLSCPISYLQSIPEMITTSDKILSCLRNQSTYQKKNWRKAPATLSKTINKIGLVESSIPVNMVGGPIGHADGMAMSDIR